MARICWRGDFNSDTTVMLNSILSLKNKQNEPNVSCSCRNTNTQTRSQSDLSSECSTTSPQNKLSKINAYFHPDRETRVEPILQSVPSNNRRRRGHDRCCQILWEKQAQKSSKESTWLYKQKEKANWWKLNLIRETDRFIPGTVNSINLLILIWKITKFVWKGGFILFILPSFYLGVLLENVYIL